MLATTRSAGLATSSGYDAAGRLVTTTSSIGTVTVNEYDQGGRLIRVTENYTSTGGQNYQDLYNLITSFGKLMDPLADKVLANVLLVYLACRQPHWVPLWMVLLLLGREFAVQGFRSLAPCVGVVIGTGRLNKYKTILQLVACGTAVGGLAWPALAPLLQPSTRAVLALALAAALWSMFTLFRDNADLWRRTPLALQQR